MNTSDVNSKTEAVGNSAGQMHLCFMTDGLQGKEETEEGHVGVIDLRHLTAMCGPDLDRSGNKPYKKL